MDATGKIAEHVKKTTTEQEAIEGVGEERNEDGTSDVTMPPLHRHLLTGQQWAKREGEGKVKGKEPGGRETWEEAAGRQSMLMEVD